MTFVPGHELSRVLYEEIVAPLFASRFPTVAWGAALLGAGSDVLGYDTARSMDHDWGPRLNIIVRADERDDLKPRMLDALDAALPTHVRGIPVDIPGSANMPGDPVRHHHRAGGRRNHGVRIDALGDLMQHRLDATSIAKFSTAHWLSTPQQTLLEFTAGPVFRDGTGELTALRDVLAWYPPDLWMVQMAARWKRIAQNEAFLGRCGELGDDIGSHQVAMVLLDDAMHLAFLQERRYAPYRKWFGSAFARLDAASHLTPKIEAVLLATSWPEREAALLPTLVYLGERHNKLGLTDPVPPDVRLFHDRPFRVIFAERYTRALQAALEDDRLPADLGGIDQFVDSTDAIGNGELRAALRDFYASDRQRQGSGQ